MVSNRELETMLRNVMAAQGALTKQSLLKKYGEVVGFADVLQFIYNPYFKTGISRQKFGKAAYFAEVHKPTYTSGTDYTIFALIDYLWHNNTGTDADLLLIARHLCNTDAKWLVEAVVTQNAKIGVTATTLNKVFGPGFIPVVGCMLGTKYEDVANVQWPCIVTEKLDGIRRILIKDNGVCRMYSRSGHEDNSLVDILAEAVHLPDNHVYDGELIAIGEHKDAIATRQATSSASAKQGDKGGLVFNVFDTLPTMEFYSGVSSMYALMRKARLHKVLEELPDLRFIKEVPVLKIADNFDEVAAIAANIWNAGGEGVMLNEANSLYEVKRSKHLIKLKRVKEYELPVVGFLEGKGKYTGMVGSILVDYKGQHVAVGSGLTDDDRAYIWDNQEAYLGSIVELDSFGESVNKQGIVSLNCPIFKRFKVMKGGQHE
jgi:DNA ligase-1